MMTHNNDNSEEFDNIENDGYNDDVQFEEETDDTVAKKLRKRLSDCQKEKQQYIDSSQRLKADFINARKEFEKKKQEYVTFAREGLIEDLLPVVDSFDMAFSNKESWEKVDQNWRTGVEYIHSQLMKVLTDNGLSTLDPLGELFDPKHHTSVASEETDDNAKDGHIARVQQKGYALHGKVVRSPKVVVFSLKD
jgi:molecular chaperone GrpE